MERPNVVFVFADQLRYQALGSSGNPVVKTPNLDRLAEQGVVFENAFSCCPVCSPYRGQLLTGRYSHCNGVIDNEYALRPEETTLPHVLKHQGYVTGFVGKWHLGYGPYAEDVRYGFDYMAAYNCNHDYYRLTYHENELGPYPINAWGPEGETDIALRFIDETSTSGNGKPFALFLAWGPPHWPYDRYPREYQIYGPKEVDLPLNVPVQMADFARREIADYYGNVTALDAQMGRLMEHLEACGLSDRTIVCFSSDHGDHLSAHGHSKPMDDWLPPLKRSSKCTPYEESIHIPFILRHPTAAVGGRRTQTLFSSVDVMPTLLGLCDIEIPEGLQGHDLSHAVRGEEGFEPDSVRVPTDPWASLARPNRIGRLLAGRAQRSLDLRSLVAEPVWAVALRREE